MELSQLSMAVYSLLISGALLAVAIALVFFGDRLSRYKERKDKN